METKRVKLTEEVKRRGHIVSSKVDMLTIPQALRGDKNKKEFLASLSQEDKDAMDADAFRFLIKIIQCNRGDDAYDYLYELVQDVVSNNQEEWFKEPKSDLESVVDKLAELLAARGKKEGNEDDEGGGDYRFRAAFSRFLLYMNEEEVAEQNDKVCLGIWLILINYGLDNIQKLKLENDADDMRKMQKLIQEKMAKL